MLDENQNKHYMNWIVIALLDFVTIISFENIFYPFQNQGLSVVISWIFLLFSYVIPYALIATQLGLTFKNQDGGLASWIRRGTLICLATLLLGCIGPKQYLTWSMFQILLLFLSVGLS